MQTQISKPMAQALGILAEGFSGPMLIDERGQRQLMGRLQRLSEVVYRMDDCSPKSIPMSKSNGIATIPIIGVLTKYAEWYDEYCGFVAARSVESVLNRAANDSDVEAIVLEIDSPGGMVAGTTELAKVIAHIDTEIKPVYAVISDMCASGGYWLASQCRKRFANDVACVGSIGVYVCWPDLTKYFEEMGVTWNLISTGRYKGLGADYKVTDDLKEQEQKEINAIYEQFIAAIVSGTGMKDAEVRALADGRCWIGAQAKQNGLVNEIASRDAAYQAILTEVSPMNAESFKTYAAEHPEAVNEYVEKGRKEGSAAARSAEIQRLRDLTAAAGGRTQMAIDAFFAGQDVDTFKLAVAAVERETKAANEAVTSTASTKDAEIAELKKKLEAAETAAGGQGAVGTAGAAKAKEAAEKKEAEASGEKNYASAEAQAKDEWAKNHENCNSRFSEKAYIAFRKNELDGNVKYNQAD